MIASDQNLGYAAAFEELNGFEPYPFQVALAESLAKRRHLVLRAPTGSGKTATVLTPFIARISGSMPERLIYAVPLRTLAQGIYAEARKLAEKAGGNPDEFVTMQTGEQPDDGFFSKGRIVVTTYDQVLSGLLSAPYGLSPVLHNINSAAIAGALVVFDEFHLMEPDKAFLTGAAGLRLFRGLTQSIWMTATATSPLLDILTDALDALDVSPAASEVASLPSVSETRKTLVYEPTPMTAEGVIAASSGRTIVMCNTVPRAQALFLELRNRLPASVPVILLHARFFKPDRDAKVTELRRLFGKESHGRAVLVSTQVIEAGIDITCDDLHTELCPMNALIQRAGRCARYPGEEGTIHVYPLADSVRAWLPYGSLQEPDGALTATQHFLAAMPGDRVDLTPDIAETSVQQVHRETDQRALREGWKGRRQTLLHVIRQNSIEHARTGVSQYIREASVDDVRVVLGDPLDLPSTPWAVEGLTLSRWQLMQIFRDEEAAAEPLAWSWDFRERPEPSQWVAIEDSDGLLGKYVVCISTAVASYTEAAGLLVGTPGDRPSPPRAEMRRPGYSPKYRSEAWSDHALAVAEATMRRAADDGIPGWLAEGIMDRYGLTLGEVLSLVRVTGLLHDLGKLQIPWQDWAEAWQRSIHPDHVHTVGLAHTDYDPDNPVDRARERTFSPRRPGHATASAYAGLGIVGDLLNARPEFAGALISACLSAVASHHGAWIPDEQSLGVKPLWRRWRADLADAHIHPQNTALVDRLFTQMDRRTPLAKFLNLTTSPDNLEKWWPLVAYLMRMLRLADQRATSEGTARE